MPILATIYYARRMCLKDYLYVFAIANGCLCRFKHIGVCMCVGLSVYVGIHVNVCVSVYGYTHIQCTTYIVYVCMDGQTLLIIMFMYRVEVVVVVVVVAVVVVVVVVVVVAKPFANRFGSRYPTVRRIHHLHIWGPCGAIWGYMGLVDPPWLL